ncbi:hypothetical protein B0H19DRAFT_1179597 [Mycena capillaripes]|nr:hypothetical protein B0H19DRAFT_1179597 [Mycena capillaripes]
MPKASSSARSRRPGPLEELPLDLCLPPNPNLPQRTNKRVHSPSLFSPTKRRILAEEGIISPGALKSPIRVSAFPVGRDSGGDSPAKKLDFGLPKNSPASARLPHNAPTSATEFHMMRLTRPNTTLDAFTPSTSTSPVHVDDVQEMIDYFSTPSEGISSRLARGAVLQTPRDIPPPVDPQSIHYPGFVVFQDAYTVTGPAITIDVDAMSSPQKEPEKENVQPRRKPRKSATAPTSSDLKTRLTSPDARLAKANSTPCTPGRSLAGERLNSTTPTARRPEVILTRDTRLTPKVQDMERRELRRRLVEEVDDVLNDDEEDV